MNELPAKVLARRRNRCLSWVDRQNYEGAIGDLIKEYALGTIVLYTGAGVSAGPNELIDGKQYGLPTWIDLLREVAGNKGQIRLTADPWRAADQSVRYCGGKRNFQKSLQNIIRRPVNYTRKYGSLPSPFVSNAKTLEATAAFCGVLKSRIVNPDVKNETNTKVHFRSEANPRLHSVITANYDCFLESAASTIYRKSPLQPVTAKGSLASSSTRIPVFHIHGYVPHPFYQLDIREPSIDRLILTKSDYERAWDMKDVFGTTMGPQIHLLRYFTALFIGFSFSDKYVCELLRQIYTSYLRYAERSHFALIPKSEVAARGHRYFRRIGVRPISYDRFEEIPELLGTIYEAGLVIDLILNGNEPESRIELPSVKVKTHEPRNERFTYSPSSMWALARKCRYESVGRKFLQDHELAA